MINTSTLRPGLLVGLSTTIKGNVKYRTQMLEEEHLTESGAEAARWETERTITDPDEHERAKKARSKARNAIVRHTAQTPFGLLAPEDRIADLEAGIAEARRITDLFNSTAQVTRVHVYVMVGKVANTDAEAIRAVNAEVRNLIEQMENGIQKLDVAVIRDAADKAKDLSQMLSPAAQERVQNVVEIVRTEAKRIVKAGETAVAEIDQAALARLTETRLAFLDLEDANEVKAPEATGLALDLMPAEDDDEGYDPLAYNNDGSLAGSEEESI